MPCEVKHSQTVFCTTAQRPWCECFFNTCGRYSNLHLFVNFKIWKNFCCIHWTLMTEKSLNSRHPLTLDQFGANAWTPNISSSSWKETEHPHAKWWPPKAVVSKLPIFVVKSRKKIFTLKSESKVNLRNLSVAKDGHEGEMILPTQLLVFCLMGTEIHQ